jgi:hypothetical protein
MNSIKEKSGSRSFKLPDYEDEGKTTYRNVGNDLPNGIPEDVDL